MPGRRWKFSKAWTAGCQYGMKAASFLPRKRRPARYSSETATDPLTLLLSLLPAPTVWANAGPRLSNPCAHGQRTRGIKRPSLTAQPQQASLKPPPCASRLPAQADVPSEGEVEGNSESQAQRHVAKSNRAGLGNPQRHCEKIPGLYGPTTAATPGWAHDVSI